MERINPHYNPEKLGLEMLTFDEPDMSYEFNTLCFWSTGDGRVYSASDSGSSCPTPFEDYEGADQKEVLQKLERVGSVEQAAYTFDSWNKSYDGKPLLPQSEKEQCLSWVKSNLAKRPAPIAYSPGERLVLPEIGKGFGFGS